MPRHRILLQSNPVWLKTGLAENSKTLLQYLYRRGHDIAHYATQGTPSNHPHLALTPWKSYGCIPPDQEVINRMNADPVFGRNASYGSILIDAVVKDWKPTIWIGSDDVWAMPLADYAEKPWYRAINSIHHVTIDSVPVIDQAFEQAKRSKTYLTWARFAATEMKRVGGAAMNHVSSVYGAMDTDAFSPIAPQEKADLRKQFGITPDTVVFLFVFRNQLRKSANTIMEAFARFKRENPTTRAALHFHTSFSEKGAGWDIPKMAAFYGLTPTDILCTYVCKTCGAWSVAPYGGEDLKCPACGTDKSLVTANIINGVPGSQMRYVYGISDACLSVFTSGGQEYHSVQSLLCGKPLACTDYSCGEDFCIDETKGFVTPVRWHPYHEPGTNFVKAANDTVSLAAFMKKVARMSERDRAEAGERGRDWAIKTFGIEAIGAQWEKLFESLPVSDWSTVDLTAAPAKNPSFQPPSITDNVEWLKAIYKGILLMDVGDEDSGLGHWVSKLAGGMTREAIHAYFVSVAQQENAKSGHSGTADFASLLDTTSRARGLIVIKESAGDVAMVTALFRSFHEQHPNTDLYVATDPRYAELLAGNEHVHKVLPYLAAMENEMLMTGQAKGPAYFACFYHVASQTQRMPLTYLSQPEPAFDIGYPQ